MTAPTLDELTQEVDASTSIIEDAQTQQVIEQNEIDAAMDREERFMKMTAYGAHHKNKSRWSQFVMGLMGGMITFQCILLAFVGWNWWDFTAYPWLLPALLVQNLAQVIALAHTIVKALHDGHKD